mmetsp:Transcript_4948/g.5746  ORF Transcript_4948/g.5746 Transcript_4948/m.5746 type:complete len:231 (+) Transcript_4948:137-829(+)
MSTMRSGRTSMPSDNDVIPENDEGHDRKYFPKWFGMLNLARKLHCGGRTKSNHSSKHSSNTNNSNKSGRRKNIEVNRTSEYNRGITQYTCPRPMISIDQIVRVLAAGHKAVLSKTYLAPSIEAYRNLMRIERQRDWLISFYHLDPRYQINKCFNDVARAGANRLCEDGKVMITEEAIVPIALKYFREASAFSVFRPTSKDAIRKMMMGGAKGKGLEVKGKSAKKRPRSEG